MAGCSYAVLVVMVLAYVWKGRGRLRVFSGQFEAQLRFKPNTQRVRVTAAVSLHDVCHFFFIRTKSGTKISD
jgi:hypothetical protein